jgi:hypothetical protein
MDININYVTLLLSGTLIEHGAHEVWAGKKEGAKPHRKTNK